MKINWGFGIAIFYASFMTILLFYVIKSTTYDNSLVLDNYYEQDLNYQSHFDKIANQQQLTQKVKANYDAPNQSVEFVFPATMQNSEGNIHFFNPMTKHQDVVKEIALNTAGSMSVSTKNLKKGRWKIKIDWVNAEKAYFQEIELFL